VRNEGFSNVGLSTLFANWLIFLQSTGSGPADGWLKSLFPFVTCRSCLGTAQFPGIGGSMSKAVRTTLGLVVSLALLSAMALAEPGKTSDKSNNGGKQHHSRFAKAAFWRHHGKNDKSSKNPEVNKQQAKKAQSAHVKPVAANQASHKSSQKEKQQASKVAGKKAPSRKVANSKAATQQHVAKAHGPVKHHTAAKAEKSHEKTQHSTTASLR
jgi:hypothetical protein